MAEPTNSPPPFGNLITYKGRRYRLLMGATLIAEAPAENWNNAVMHPGRIDVPTQHTTGKPYISSYHFYTSGSQTEDLVAELAAFPAKLEKTLEAYHQHLESGYSRPDKTNSV